jgi:anti-sigma28 factor (negative regulator of flagellin synthesis)
MRIDNFQNIPAVLQSFGASSAGKTEQSNKPDNAASSVSLSSFAEVLQSLQRDSLQVSQSNLARVEQLAKQEEAGKLTVNVNKLASSLVESNVIDTKG